MRGEQQRSPAPISAASSWADTDSDSDSDSGRHYAIRDTNSSSSKPAKMLPALERTAPMMIPQQSRHRHVRRVSYFENECEQDESLPSRHSAVSFTHNSSTFEHSDDDESDDPALYQNLAYFRSHSARKAASHRGARSWSSSPSSPSSPLSSQSDEDIFDMEL